MAMIGEFYEVTLPWPESPTDGQYTKAAGALGETVSATPTAAEKAVIGHSMSLLSDRVEQYAAGAPISAKREAVARFHGYLVDAQNFTFESVDIGGGLKAQETTRHGPAFRNCGAAAILAPWRQRTAVAF